MGDLIDLSLERQHRLEARRALLPTRCPACGGVEGDENELLGGGRRPGECLELEADLEEALEAADADHDDQFPSDDDPEKSVPEAGDRVARRPPWSLAEDGDVPF